MQSALGLVFKCTVAYLDFTLMSESSNRSVVEALAEKILLKKQLDAKYRLFFKVSQDSSLDNRS